METLEEVLDLFDKLDDERPPVQSDVQSLLADIDANVGADEFKSLAHDSALIAPGLVGRHMEKIYFGKKYLFSINDGCGLERYLEQLSALVGKLGLQGKNSGRFSLFKLQLAKNSNDDPCESLLHDLCIKDAEEHVCIDICDWMNDVNTPVFKHLLMSINEICKKNIVVFRIPFVAKDVLIKIYRALNDVLFIRTVSFPPYTIEQIDQIAAKQISAYNFEISNDSWKYFNQRIREESGDGRFYGEETVSKVVNELLYTKLLCCAKNNRDDMVITSSDTEKLCKTEFDDGRSGSEILGAMVGVEKIKEQVMEMVSQILLLRDSNVTEMPCIHMKFVGNPGTGKTTVARAVGKLLQENGVLRVGDFFEHGGRDFCGRYIGETAPKTLSLCREAYGSVLFIDEAYSLFKGTDDTRDFGKEALDTLIAEMENHRSDMVVVMAGYPEDMERLMKGNSGLESRIPYTIEFPNFTGEQLYEIFLSMSRNKLPKEEGLDEDAQNYFTGLDRSFISSKTFSNARYVRNLYERLCAKAAMRCQLAGEKKITLLREDFAMAILDKEFANMPKSRRIGFGG